MNLLNRLNDLSELITQSAREHKQRVLGQEEYLKLTMVQFQYIAAIHKLGRPTFKELAETFQVSKPSITSVVNKLIAEGLVYKVQSSDDRRVFHVSLTDRGSDVIAAEQTAYKKLVHSITEALSPEECANLEATLDKIIALHRK